MKHHELTHAIIGAAVEVQKTLGVGLLESAYASALAHELTLRGLGFERERPIEVAYKNASVGVAYRADFVVEEAVVLELKAVEAVMWIHRAQLLSYVRLAGYKLGLLINFHEAPLSRGIHRVVNNL